MVNKNFNLLSLVIIMLIFLTAVLLSSGYTIALSQKSSGNDRWLKGKSLPTPRTEVMPVSLDLVYVIGGFTNEERITNTVEVYNTTNNLWDIALIPLPIPLHQQLHLLMMDESMLQVDIREIGIRVIDFHI